MYLNGHQIKEGLRRFIVGFMHKEREIYKYFLIFAFNYPGFFCHNFGTIRVRISSFIDSLRIMVSGSTLVGTLIASDGIYVNPFYIVLPT